MLSIAQGYPLEIKERQKMKGFKQAILVLVLVPLAGCITLPEIVQRAKVKNMKGKPIETAFAEFGPPSQVYEIPSGVVYEWSSYRENVRNELIGARTAPGPAGLTVYQTYGDVTYRYKCVMNIFVSRSTQMIADHTMEGNDCKAW